MTLRFLLAEGIGSLRRVAAASTIGAILTGVALAIIGGLALLGMAYRAELRRAGASVSAEIFLEDGISRQRAAQIADEATAFAEVESARVRSPEEAIAIFGAGLNHDSTLLAGDIQLPTTIELELAGTDHGMEGLKSLASRLQMIVGIEDVTFPDELVRTVEERSGRFLTIALVVGLALGMSVIGVVANTAQLTVLSRRSVIRTMQLLGAERRWVLAPFIVQGSLIGTAGGILATIALYGSWFVIPGLEGFLRESELQFFPLVFPVAGALLGALGAVLASGYSMK